MRVRPATPTRWHKLGFTIPASPYDSNPRIVWSSSSTRSPTRTRSFYPADAALLQNRSDNFFTAPDPCSLNGSTDCAERTLLRQGSGVSGTRLGRSCRETQWFPNGAVRPSWSSGSFNSRPGRGRSAIQYHGPLLSFTAARSRRGGGRPRCADAALWRSRKDLRSPHTRRTRTI